MNNNIIWFKFDFTYQSTLSTKMPWITKLKHKETKYE